MQTIPSTKDSLMALMRADFTTQWRNRRSAIMAILVPVIILISWKGIAEKTGAAFVLSNAISFGLTAIGLMGYAITIARDRDKGVFQRLRVSPIPTWTIMMSRISVQLAMILILTLVVYVVGYNVDKISISPIGYLLGFFAAFIGGAVYLGLGQMIVGLIKNAETVNSTTRLIFFFFIMIGVFGELAPFADMGSFGKVLSYISKYSPYGTVRRILSVAMEPSKWSPETTISLLATIGYAIIFSTLGIKWFRWNSK
jgi:ABC-2 type transport system permease protein